MASEVQTESPALYGLLVEFDDPHDLLVAARRVRDAGYRRIDAYTPMPVDGLAAALGVRRTRMPLVILTGGILGGLAGFALQVWVNVFAYPLNIGGRPLVSWPSFVPVTFEMTILTAALFGVLGMLALNGLPKPHHPLFAVPEFDQASQSRFFLCIEASDPQFDAVGTRDFLAELAGDDVFEVPQTDR